MCCKNLVSVLVIVLSAQCISWAQILDTTDAHHYKPTNVGVLNEQEITFLLLDTTRVDTQLNGFYNYYPAYKNSFPFIDQGLEATAVLPLAGSQDREVNLRLGVNHVQPYFFDNNIHIYQTSNPFTRLNYSQGNKEMLSIAATHAQQISKRLAFGIDYRRIKNQNIYYSNLANLATIRMGNLFNTKFYTSYFTKDRKYELIASYVWNKSKNAETGGMVSDSAFNSLAGREKLDNNRARFTQALGTHVQNNFKLTHYYRPGGKSTDSTLNQSLSQFTNQFSWTTQMKNERVEFLDENPDSANYGMHLQPYKDSLYHRTLSNKFSYLFHYKVIDIAASILHSYNSIYQNGAISVFNNVYFDGAARLKIKSIRLNGEARLGVLGYNFGDYTLAAKAKTKIKMVDLEASFRSQLQEPDFLAKTFYTQAYFWNNSFGKSSINKITGAGSISLQRHTLQADVLAETINNRVYYSGDNEVKQHQDFVSLLQTQIAYTYHSPWVGLDAKSIFQNSSNQNVLPRPAVSIYGNTFVNFSLFKKNLKMQVGSSIFWFSKFKAPKYNPVTRNWHNSSDEYSQYSPLNVYANALVKSVCIGVEYFHVQQGLFGTAYYSAPSYPMMQRTFRLNIRWDLSD